MSDFTPAPASADLGVFGTGVMGANLGFVAALRTPRVAIIMVQAGAATEAVIEELSALMEPGDIIVDAGNTLYTDTRRREEALR